MLALTLLSTNAGAQILKKLGRRIENKVKQRIERKADEAIDRGLDEVEDAAEGRTGQKKEEDETTNVSTADSQAPDSAGNGDPMVYAKFDFIPGNAVLFYDDFSADAMGDFPSKWNTNGGGEVVALGEEHVRFLQLKGGSLYLPTSGPLPDAYTIEFDLKTTGLSREISSASFLDIMLDESSSFQSGSKRVFASLSLCQYISNGLPIGSYGGSAGTIKNTIDEDYRAAIAGGPHIAIAVNKNRFRLWLNARKMVDIPTLVPPGTAHLKLRLRGFDTDYKQMGVFIGNVKIAAGGIDLRSELLAKGRWSTSGIRFEVNSARVRPESYGVLKAVAEVLKANPDINVAIVGHTDSDGADDLNQQLSEQRAAAVKQVLINTYGITAERMETTGRGESEPVADNSNGEGKAQNRRVEFIKQSS